MTQLQNSSFKVKAAPVPEVAEILPESGAIVFNKRDGFIYYADSEGWKQLVG